MSWWVSFSAVLPQSQSRSLICTLVSKQKLALASGNFHAKNRQSRVWQHDILFPRFRYPSSYWFRTQLAQISSWTPMMSFFQILNFTTTLQRFLITGFAGSFRVSSNQTLHSYPTVNIVNGSYMGIHNEIYNQHLFLGIPYAQPPVGNLRFRAPISLNTTWNGTREAVKYSDIVSQNRQILELC